MASSPDNTPAAIPPRPGSGPGSEIAPQLESVLRNLNINLEDELTRYRRQRHGRVPPPPPPRRAAQRQTIDLISVPASAPGGDTASGTASSDTASDTAPGGMPGDTAPGKPQQSPTPPPPPPNPFLKQTPDPATPDADALELPDMTQPLDMDEALTNLEDDIPEPEGATLPVHAHDTPPDGYLESSEELLKSIADEPAEPASVPEPYSPDRKNNGLLKLAGLVLVLLAGIGVGFAITYPSQLQNLRSRLWPTGTAPEAETEATADDAPSVDSDPSSEPVANAPETTLDGYKPPGPDLSTREFEELDLESLSTLEIDGTTGNGTAPTTPSALPNNPAQSPLPAPTSASTPATGQPTPATPDTTAANTAPAAATPPATAPAAPATANPVPPATAGSNFYVVASYTGDASLNQARELVPDAFVRNFKAGARIQLAAFDNRAQAEEQVAFLTQQGATVELFGPTNE